MTCSVCSRGSRSLCNACRVAVLRGSWFSRPEQVAHEQAAMREAEQALRAYVRAVVRARRWKAARVGVSELEEQTKVGVLYKYL